MRNRTSSIKVLSEQIDIQTKKIDNIKAKAVVNLNEYQIEKILLEGLISSWIDLMDEE